MADPQITVGMKFGTYTEAKVDLSTRYVEVPESKKTDDETIVLDRKAYQYKEVIGKEQSGALVLGDTKASLSKKISLFIKGDSQYEKRYDISANYDGFSYSNTGSKDDGEKFTMIKTDSQIAYDYNKNGYVDEGEIHDR